MAKKDFDPNLLSNWTKKKRLEAREWHATRWSGNRRTAPQDGAGLLGSKLKSCAPAHAWPPCATRSAAVRRAKPESHLPY